MTSIDVLAKTTQKRIRFSEIRSGQNRAAYSHVQAILSCCRALSVDCKLSRKDVNFAEHPAVESRRF